MSDDDNRELDIAGTNSVVGVDHLGSLKGELKQIGGSRSDFWNGMLIDQTVESLWRGNADAKQREEHMSAVLAGMIGIAPQDELEGMLASQMIAAHCAAMECHRRAMHSQQSPEVRQMNLAQATKLSRAYAALLEALNRHRGKGQQKVTVEHVHVHAGGQAVVGMVAAPGQPGGGGASKFEEQPHAKQIAHALEPAMPCPDEGPNAVPIARDGERALPDARRQDQGRAKGQ